MAPRYIGLDPTQVIWENLRIIWWERIIRYSATIAFVVAMTIFWSIPTAVVGFISNVKWIAGNIFWLHWLLDLPSVILGFISGLLPSVLMSVLLSLVPVVLRRELPPFPDGCCNCQLYLRYLGLIIFDLNQ